MPHNWLDTPLNVCSSNTEDTLHIEDKTCEKSGSFLSIVNYRHMQYYRLRVSLCLGGRNGARLEERGSGLHQAQSDWADQRYPGRAARHRRLGAFVWRDFLH